MVPHMNGIFLEFLNGYYHYDKHNKLYSSQIFENPNIFGSISKFYWTVIGQIENQTQPECTVQSGSSPKSFRNCAHCSSHLVEDKFSGNKFIIHSSASAFAVVYYCMIYSCGNPDWVLDPNIIQQLTSLFETNDCATSAIAYKKLFEDKLRTALNATNKEAQNAHMKDLIS